MNYKAIGTEVSQVARRMASPARVKKVVEDQKHFEELSADLASFVHVARQCDQFKGVADAIMMTLAFLSYVRIKAKERELEQN